MRTGMQLAPVRAPADRAGGRGEPGRCVASDIRRWAETCYSERDLSTETDIQDLIHEASEAARDDYGVDSANEWAEGYRFPEEYVTSDIKFPQSQMLDFTSMVRRRLKQLAPDRLSNERVEGLRLDYVPELHLCKAHRTTKKGKTGIRAPFRGSQLHRRHTAEYGRDCGGGNHALRQNPTPDDRRHCEYDISLLGRREGKGSESAVDRSPQLENGFKRSIHAPLLPARRRRPIRNAPHW
jgi:hypothetical protein